MNLKLDENIIPQAKEILVQAGHDVITVQDEALSGSSDNEIAAVLSHEGRCFLTLDLHFANILAYPPQKYSGMVTLRHPRLTVKGLLNLIYQFIISLRDQDPRGKLWIVEPGRLRIQEGTDSR